MMAPCWEDHLLLADTRPLRQLSAPKNFPWETRRNQQEHYTCKPINIHNLIAIIIPNEIANLLLFIPLIITNLLEADWSLRNMIIKCLKQNAN